MSRLIFAKFSLGVIRRNLESELNEHNKKHGLPLVVVTHYKLLINNLSQTCTFVVKETEYPFNDKGVLSKAVTTAIAQQIGKEVSIDVIVIMYGPDKITLTAAFKDKDGNKHQENIQL